MSILLSLPSLSQIFSFVLILSRVTWDPSIFFFKPAMARYPNYTVLIAVASTLASSMLSRSHFPHVGQIEKLTWSTRPKFCSRKMYQEAKAADIILTTLPIQCQPIYPQAWERILYLTYVGYLPKKKKKTLAVFTRIMKHTVQINYTVM